MQVTTTIVKGLHIVYSVVDVETRCTREEEHGATTTQGKYDSFLDV